MSIIIWISLFQDLVAVPENDANKKVEDMDLHRVEALLYTFHKLGKQCPDFLSKDPERQKEFKKKYSTYKYLKISVLLVLIWILKYFIIICRLLYVGTCTQTFVKVVRQELKEKDEDVKNDPVVEKKLEGLRLACNINTLIKELFNIPPRFKATITLSWLGGTATKSKLVSSINNKEQEWQNELLLFIVL